MMTDEAESTAADASAPTMNRSESLAASRKAKMDELYKGQSFEIVREVHLNPDENFTTLLGNKGRHGFIIKNVETGESQVVGASMLKRIAEDYQGVTLPEKPAKTEADAETAPEAESATAEA